MVSSPQFKHISQGNIFFAFFFSEEKKMDYLCEWTQPPSWSLPPPSLWRSKLESQTSDHWGAKHSYPLHKHMYVETLRVALCRGNRHLQESFTETKVKVGLPGQVFLLQAIAQASRTFSARPPSVPLLRRSNRIRWLSEPPTQEEKRTTRGNYIDYKAIINMRSQPVFKNHLIWL